MSSPTHGALARPEVVSEQLPVERPGWMRLAASGDHKAVGKLYIATALAFCAFALTELVLMRVQLIIPDFGLIRPEIFDRLLSAYGVTALLLFAIPLLLGLFSYVVPLQIGARGVALPRLGALSYWLYLLGGVTLYGSFLYTPSEAGTSALPPLSSEIYTATHGVDAWAVGVGLVALAMVLFAINMVTTIGRLRAPGMVWRRLPLFSAAAAVCSWTLLVVGPIVVAALAMLLIDRNFDGVFFEAGEGGAPLLYMHLSWIFLTGAYVVTIVGAFGAISEILPTFSRQPQFGHRTIAASLVAFAVLGVLAWMQNMYSAPIPIGFLYFAMAMAVAAVIPVGLILFNWVATVAGGSVRVKTPMLFAIGAVVVSVYGLAGEWAQSLIPVSWQVADTGVAWGDTHAALIGAGVLGGFAALYYWFPKISGRLMGDGLGRASFWAIVLGGALMVVPIQLAGLDGMAVDVYKFYADTGMSATNLIGSIGSFLLAAGIVLTLINAAASLRAGTAVGHDPWGGATLEWFALSPPPAHNFDLVPDVRSNEPLRDIRDAIRRGEVEWTPPPATVPGERPAPVGAGSGESEVAAAEGARESTADQQPSGDELDEPTERRPDDGPAASGGDPSVA